jgi:hypothetical protein
MPSKIIAVIAALILIGTRVPAQQSEDVLVGAGTSTCSEFLELSRHDAGFETDFFGWAQGFMTGINWQLNANASTRNLQRNLSGMDEEAQRLHIRQYCDRHPSEPYLAAVYDVYKQLPTIPSKN